MIFLEASFSSLINDKADQQKPLMMPLTKELSIR